MVELQSAVDPLNRFLLKAVQLLREPARRHTTAPYLPLSEAPWRCSLLMMDTGRIIREDWQKLAGIGGIEFKEAAYVKVQPKWVVHVHADRRQGHRRWHRRRGVHHVGRLAQ